MAYKSPSSLPPCSSFIEVMHTDNPSGPFNPFYSSFYLNSYVVGALPWAEKET